MMTGISLVAAGDLRRPSASKLKKLCAHKRTSLLEATRRELDKVSAMVRRGTLRGKAEIGVRAGKVIDKCKVAKHFVLDIREALPRLPELLGP